VEEISIGEFTRRSRLSLKALRLYDELGVLVPSRRSGSCSRAIWLMQRRASLSTGATPKPHTTRGTI
jgi:hypothetical protein